jgi:F0F1-type ATP synthase membrane subunit b/b'
MNGAFYAQLAIWSDIASAVIFLAVLVWLWVKYLTPAIIASRDRKNAELLETVQRRDAVKAEVEVARRELGTAEGEVTAIRARAGHDSARLRERTVSEAAAEGERVVRNAEGELGRGRLAARERLRDELLARALEIARESAKKLGEGPDRRLMGEVIDSLERGNA